MSDYTYAILGAGRQGTSAAFDLAKFGSAKKIFLADIGVHGVLPGGISEAAIAQCQFIDENAALLKYTINLPGLA